MATRKYTRSGRREVINGNNFLSKIGQYTVACLPVAALEVARIFLANRGSWASTYAMEYFDDDYRIPDATELDQIQEVISEFLKDTNDMDCTEFSGALAAIEASIRALASGGGCGCGSGGGAETSGPPDDTDTGDITGTAGTPPPGYPDWQTYQLAKCDIATHIVNNILADVRWWQAVQIATITLAGLSAGMVSILSAFTLTAILAGLIALIAYEASVLDDIEQAIIDNFDDLVCAILSGTDAQSSMDNYTSEMDTILGVAIADGVTEYLAQVLMAHFADTESFNLLYADYEDYLGRQIPTGSDCSSCGLGCHNTQLDTGVWLGGNTYQSEFSGGVYRVEGKWNIDLPYTCGTDECGPMEQVTMSDLLGHTPTTAGNPDFRVWGDVDCPFTSSNASVWASDSPWTTVCGRKWSILSNTAFTVQLTGGGHCS